MLNKNRGVNGTDKLRRYLSVESRIHRHGDYVTTDSNVNVIFRIHFANKLLSRCYCGTEPCILMVSVQTLLPFKSMFEE